MNITRRDMCGSTVAGTLLMLVQGCGGGGDDAAQAPGSSCGASGAAISLNHGHALLIAAVDLDSAVDIIYSIRGTSDHDHALPLAVAQLRQLKTGASVMAQASVASAHAHVVTVTCAG